MMMEAQFDQPSVSTCYLNLIWRKLEPITSCSFLNVILRIEPLLVVVVVVDAVVVTADDGASRGEESAGGSWGALLVVIVAVVVVVLGASAVMVEARLGNVDFATS